LTNSIVDIYLPLDSRDAPNSKIWPVANRQLESLVKVIRKCGWEPHVLNPDKFVASVAEGIRVIKRAKGARFIDFMAGWSYPDFSVSPMWQMPAEVPKLMLGSSTPDFPGNVGLLASVAGTTHVGIKASRLFVEEFEKPETYADAIETFLRTGTYTFPSPKPIDIPVTAADLASAKKAVTAMKGMIYGAVGPRSMQMWNKISEADFLSTFGIAREGFDGLRVLKMAEAIPELKAEEGLRFLLGHKMRIDFGKNPAKHLTKNMVLFQLKVYFALLELRRQYGLDFLGVQDQLDWIEYYPATDLALGLLNNRLRPSSDGQTIVAATEADDGAALTMQVLKLLNGGEPVGFNDFRYWDAKEGLYWFVNSGALAPYFAQGRHDTFEGAWSKRQTPMYFKHGGGTSSLVVRIPGPVTWARFSYRDHRLYLAAGRGITDVPTDDTWRERARHCNGEWPHWYIRLCGRVEWQLNSNHPMTAIGDHLGKLKAFAAEVGIPFECYDSLTPADLENGRRI
jgi:L-fucose isomerase